MICMLLLFAAPATLPAIENIAVGQEPVGFSLPSLAGSPLSLDYFAGGPGVIIFWSTWSPRSREILENFKGYYESRGEKGLKVIAVNADSELLSESNRNEVARVARELDLPFPVVFDVGLRTYAAYGVMALPSTVVVGADGRIAYTLGGYPPAYRELLMDRVVLAVDGADPAPIRIADESLEKSTGKDDSVCVLPRAHYCQLQAGNSPGASAPGVQAVRLAVCRGDVEDAERMMRGVEKEQLGRGDLRFALAGLMLLKGRTAEAAEAFRALQQRHPAEGWGDWGLGLLALTEGNEGVALAHMRAAAMKGVVSAEAETAVLRFLSAYWKEHRSAPAEEGFLSIFRTLVAVRDCFERRG
jgi:cytochrome c biogenesis protein CcmG/thiol:disulfide interchange protein DsbE